MIIYLRIFFSEVLNSFLQSRLPINSRLSAISIFKYSCISWLLTSLHRLQIIMKFSNLLFPPRARSRICSTVASVLSSGVCLRLLSFIFSLQIGHSSPDLEFNFFLTGAPIMRLVGCFSEFRKAIDWALANLMRSNNSCSSELKIVTSLIVRGSDL